MDKRSPIGALGYVLAAAVDYLLHFGFAGRAPLALPSVSTDGVVRKGATSIAAAPAVASGHCHPGTDARGADDAKSGRAGGDHAFAWPS